MPSGIMSTISKKDLDQEYDIDLLGKREKRIHVKNNFSASPDQHYKDIKSKIIMR
jgi:hypothetical protein